MTNTIGRLPTENLNLLLENAWAMQKNAFSTDLVKCRLLYTAQGIETIEFHAYTPQPPRTLQIIEAPKLAYSAKYADRTALEALKAQRKQADDILITQDGFITDTSYCNVAFFDGKAWLTPEKPLLEGTTRARLLEAGKLQVAPLHIADLPTLVCLRLFNAMLDFEQASDMPVDCIRKYQSKYSTM
jgi:4-amino-4-deoxychorismate lyase